MELVVQTLVLGILAGGVYALVAAGVSLIFGVMRIATFAQGEMAMVGGYATFYACDQAGLHYLIALGLAGVAGALAGLATSTLLLRPLYRGVIDRPAEYVLIVTFALSQLLIATAINTVGTDPHPVDGLWSSDLHFGEWVNVGGNRIVAFAGAVALFLVLLIVVRRTDTGRAWRAMSDSGLGARVVGVDVVRQSHLCVTFSAALTGVAGGLLVPIITAFPTSGGIVLVKGFIVIVLGGLGSLRGAAIGGLLLGLFEVFPSTYYSGDFRDAYGFGLMILVLLLRPQGLFGRRERDL